MKLLRRRAIERELFDRLDDAEVRIRQLEQDVPMEVLGEVQHAYRDVLEQDHPSEALRAMPGLEEAVGAIEDALRYVEYARIVQAAGHRVPLALLLTDPSRHVLIRKLQATQSANRAEKTHRRFAHQEAELMREHVQALGETLEMAQDEARAVSFPGVADALGLPLRHLWQETIRLHQDLNAVLHAIERGRGPAQRASLDWVRQRGRLAERLSRLLDETREILVENEPLLGDGAETAIRTAARAIRPVFRRTPSDARGRRHGLSLARRLFTHPSPEVCARLAELTTNLLVAEGTP